MNADERERVGVLQPSQTYNCTRDFVELARPSSSGSAAYSYVRARRGDDVRAERGLRVGRDQTTTIVLGVHAVEFPLF